jgi:hypothetical protein
MQLDTFLLWCRRSSMRLYHDAIMVTDSTLSKSRPTIRVLRPGVRADEGTIGPLATDWKQPARCALPTIRVTPSPKEPQCGQTGPFGQMRASNHSRAKSSS